VLLGLRDRAASSREIVDAIRRDVEAFAAGTEPADDITVLVLRWRESGAAA
jgi:serine phosphatase RsbU (regulator of sigma subunit)